MPRKKVVRYEEKVDRGVIRAIAQHRVRKEAAMNRKEQRLVEAVAKAMFYWMVDDPRIIFGDERCAIRTHKYRELARIAVATMRGRA